MSTPTWKFMCGACGTIWEPPTGEIGHCPSCVGGKRYPLTEELVADMCIGSHPEIAELIARRLGPHP